MNRLSRFRPEIILEERRLNQLKLEHSQLVQPPVKPLEQQPLPQKQPPQMQGML